MKQLYIIAVSAILLCACQDKEVVDALCDINDKIAHCTDDYHYTQCTADGPVTGDCCSAEDIAAGACKKICLMKDSGAVCEDIATKPNPKDCGNGRIDHGEACDTSVPNGMTCSQVVRGSIGTLSCNDQCQIDASQCHIPEIGEHCNVVGDQNNGGCDEEGRHFYCKDGITRVQECDHFGGVCAIFAQSSRSWKAQCVNTRESCDTVGEIKRRCDSDLFDTASGYKTALHICTKDEISGKNYWIPTDDPKPEYCAHSCLWETGECGKNVPNEGTPCSPESFTPYCQGNISVNCLSDGKEGAVIQTSDCGISGMECKIYDLSPDYYNQATCIDPIRDACEVGIYYNMCINDSSNTLECTPMVGSDEHFYAINDSETCEHGCDPSTKKCLKLSEQEGKACTIKYKNNCESDDVLLYCNADNKISAKVCIDASGKTGYCVEDSKTAKCADPCDEIGITRTTCIEDAEDPHTITETCTEVDGHTVFIETGRENCAYQCNFEKTGCFKYREDDGQPCDDDLVLCDGNVLAWCEEGKRVSIDCILYDGVCVSFGNSGGTCADACDVPNEDFYQCGINDERTAYETVHYVCKEDSKGTLYKEAIQSEQCSDECNETWDGCAQCTPGEMDTVCGEYNGGTYTFYLQCKQKGDKTSWEYVMADRETYAFDECPKGCNRDRTACKKVFDTQGDVCEESSFKSSCIQGYATSCSNTNHIVGTYCDADANGSCHVSEKLGLADCVSTCSKETEVKRVCAAYPGYGFYVYENVCESVDDGLYEFTQFVKFCSGKCNANNTDCAN